MAIYYIRLQCIKRINEEEMDNIIFLSIYCPTFLWLYLINEDNSSKKIYWIFLKETNPINQIIHCLKSWLNDSNKFLTKLLINKKMLKLIRQTTLSLFVKSLFIISPFQIHINISKIYQTIFSRLHKKKKRRKMSFVIKTSITKS